MEENVRILDIHHLFIPLYSIFFHFLHKFNNEIDWKSMNYEIDWNSQEI